MCNLHYCTLMCNNVMCRSNRPVTLPERHTEAHPRRRRRGLGAEPGRRHGRRRRRCAWSAAPSTALPDRSDLIRSLTQQAVNEVAACSTRSTPPPSSRNGVGRFHRRYGLGAPLRVLLALRRGEYGGDPRPVGTVDKTLPTSCKRARTASIVGTCRASSQPNRLRRVFAIADNNLSGGISAPRGSNNEPAHPGSSEARARALVDTQP